MEAKQTPLEGSRFAWVDFIRCISIFLVIMIHTGAPLAHKWAEIPLADWMAGNFYNSFSRVSVPLLFMVSGYLLLGKQESIADFYRKRFRKVIIPFLFWSVLYLVWQNGYRNFTLINAIKAVVLAIITGPAAFHLWFLYELMAIYLFVPILRLFVLGAGRMHLWYFAAIWFLFGPIQTMVERILGISFAIDLGFFTSYIGFFVIGYLLGKTDFPAWMAAISGFVYLAAGAYTVAATYLLTYQANDFVQYYYWYTRINIVLMSFAAFIALKSIGERITSLGSIKWLNRMAGASFGIYLIHLLVLIYLERFGIGIFSYPPVYIVPAVSLIALLASWLLVELIQRIPILREAAPR